MGSNRWVDLTVVRCAVLYDLDNVIRGGVLSPLTSSVPIVDNWPGPIRHRIDTEQAQH